MSGGPSDAVAAGQLGPALSERCLALLSTLHFGVLSQRLANDPEGNGDNGTYTSLHTTVLDLFEAAYRAGEHADEPSGGETHAPQAQAPAQAAAEHVTTTS